MIRHLTYPTTIILLLLTWGSVHANIAMPGFFGAGGAEDFELFFAEDSVHLDHIEMQKELILIDLFPGYAAVKGEYRMFNRTDSSISLHIGYPLNSLLQEMRSHQRPGPYYEVHLSKLDELKVLVNGEGVAWEKLEAERDSLTDYYDEADLNNWYIWETVFAPGAETVITVYFLVNTNDAHVRDGYNHDACNGFVYLLETGKGWAGTIGEGELRIRLQDAIGLKDIKGIMPAAGIQWYPEDSMFTYNFTDLEPGYEDNLLIRYWVYDEGFDFPDVTYIADSYYSELDKGFSPQGDSKAWAGQDLFTVKGMGNFGVGTLFILAIYGIPILIILGLLILLFVFIRHWRKKRKAQTDAS